VTSISRRLYQQIILLYPEPFRREFGQEMLGVFDECRAAQGGPYLLADGLVTALKQYLHYLAKPAPDKTALCWEVPSSPRLARSLAMAVLTTAVIANAFVRDPKPKTQAWPTIRTEYRICYFPLANVKMSPKLVSSKPHKGE
jgi:hypothetical protein